MNVTCVVAAVRRWDERAFDADDREHNEVGGGKARLALEELVGLLDRPNHVKLDLTHSEAESAGSTVSIGEVSVDAFHRTVAKHLKVGCCSRSSRVGNSAIEVGDRSPTCFAA